MKRDIGKEILQGLKDIRTHKRGKKKLVTHQLSIPDAKAIRKKMGIPQSVFAAMLGVSVRTLQDWEQGRRTPQGPACSLLRVATMHPKALVDTYKKAS